MSQLSDFVSTRCTRAGACKLRELLAAFHTATGIKYTRARAVAELIQLGFQIGERDKVVHVAPLTIPATFTVANGQLIEA